MNKKNHCTGVVLAITVMLFSCSDKKETPESIAAKWCELNAQVTKATADTEKTKAISARKEFETSMETKYRKDTAMMEAIFRAVEACEGTSERKTEPPSSDTNTPDAEALLPMAYADAASVAKAFCSLVDQSVQAAQNGDASLHKIVSAKVIFEKNMSQSFENNAERRDSIFKLIEPCVAKEMQLRSK
ncbi:MAG: hypothetical protein JNL59_14065 [Chitinophagaceae bacterium]|jgi:hypothetical protein|nr:hypothetical protein [Chitinophagaceae bacterium]